MNVQIQFSFIAYSSIKSVGQLIDHYLFSVVMAMKKVCPLCFTELQEGDDQLRQHLMGNQSTTCAKHPRSKYLLVCFYEFLYEKKSLFWSLCLGLYTRREKNQ